MCPQQCVLVYQGLKKRPMISGSKIDSIFISQVEVTEYYLKMNFFCFSFALNQKYRAANFFRPIAAKSSINIEKLPKRIKNKVSNIA